MGVVKGFQQWLKDAIKSKPESLAEGMLIPRSPAYCTPTHYEVTLDKGWIVAHNGLNRKERRRLESFLRQKRPVEMFLRSGRRALEVPASKEIVKQRLRMTPFNTPVRKVYLDGKKTYVGEPEFLEFMNNPEVLEQIAQTYTPRADHIPLMPSHA